MLSADFAFPDFFWLDCLLFFGRLLRCVCDATWEARCLFAGNNLWPKLRPGSALAQEGGMLLMSAVILQPLSPTFRKPLKI